MDKTASRRPGKAKPLWHVLAWTAALLLLLSVSDAHPGARISYKGFLAKLKRNGELVVKTASQYADTHGGQFPNDLEELVSTGLFESDTLEQLLASIWANEPGPLGWIYDSRTKPGSSPLGPVLISPVLVDTSGTLIHWYHDFNRIPETKPRIPTRVVIFSDGEGRSMAETEFQQLLKSAGLTLPPPLTDKKVR